MDLQCLIGVVFMAAVCYSEHSIQFSSVCRVLYGNKITELPSGVFDGLASLELL